MRIEEKTEFAKILGILMDTYDKEISETKISIWWNVLQDISIADFRKAATQHLKTGKYAPRPADIRELAGANKSEWPTPEEAWNEIPKSESESGWMCAEMSAAMSACWDSLMRGDMFSARLAFLEAYKREIANKTGKPKWYISPSSTTTEMERLQQRQQLLMHRPERLPNKLDEVKLQLEAMCGSKRIESDLKRLGTVLRSTSLVRKS